MSGLWVSMLRNHTFVGMMGVAAAISLARSFVIAIYLVPVDFGLYATIVALAVFLSPLFGLGQIELARKAFPRLFVDGKAAEIPAIADRVVSRVGSRIALAAIALVAAVILLGETGLALAATSLAILTFGSAWILLLASALRAGPDVRPLGETTLFRAVLTFALASAFAWFFGLTGALAGEVIAILITGAAMRRRLSAMTGTAPAAAQEVGHELLEGKISAAGMRIFFASLAVSIPLYLSRPGIGMALGGEALGTFSFLMIFVMGAITIYGIAEQVIGPSVVRKQREGEPLEHQLNSVLKALVPLSAAIVGAILIAFAALRFPPLSAYVEKYQIDAGLIAPLCIFAALHCTAIVDWVFQANDGEAWQLLVSSLYLGAFVLAMILLVPLEWPLESFLWALAAAKLLQLVMQGFFLTALLRARHGGKP